GGVEVDLRSSRAGKCGDGAEACGDARGPQHAPTISPRGRSGGVPAPSCIEGHRPGDPMRLLARHHRRAALAALLALWCAASSASAQDAGPKQPPPSARIDWSERGPKIFDALVLRPLGFGAALGGAGAFLIAAPLAWYAEGIGSIYDTFVRE